MQAASPISEKEAEKATIEKVNEKVAVEKTTEKVEKAEAVSTTGADNVQADIKTEMKPEDKKHSRSGRIIKKTK